MIGILVGDTGLLVGGKVGARGVPVGKPVGAMGVAVGAMGLPVGAMGVPVGAMGVAVGAMGLPVGRNVGALTGFLVGGCVGNIGSLFGVVGIEDGWPGDGLLEGLADTGEAEGVIDAALTFPSATSVLCIFT